MSASKACLFLIMIFFNVLILSSNGFALSTTFDGVVMTLASTSSNETGNCSTNGASLEGSIKSEDDYNYGSGQETTTTHYQYNYLNQPPVIYDNTTNGTNSNSDIWGLIVGKNTVNSTFCTKLFGSNFNCDNCPTTVTTSGQSSMTFQFVCPDTNNNWQPVSLSLDGYSGIVLNSDGSNVKNSCIGVQVNDIPSQICQNSYNNINEFSFTIPATGQQCGDPISVNITSTDGFAELGLNNVKAEFCYLKIDTTPYTITPTQAGASKSPAALQNPTALP